MDGWQDGHEVEALRHDGRADNATEPEHETKRATANDDGVAAGISAASGQTDTSTWQAHQLHSTPASPTLSIHLARGRARLTPHCGGAAVMIDG